MAVGKKVPRVDGYEKVTGRAMFTMDLAPKNCLTARIYHSAIANGSVKEIDISEAEKVEGVVKIITFRDVPQIPYPTPGHPWSVEPAHQDVADRKLLTGRVRYYGDDIAAVIAEDEIAAARALKKIRVTYEEYEPCTDPREAMKGTQIPVHEEKPDNILVKSEYEIGDVDKALEESDVVVEGTYETSMVQHCHIEPPVSYAYMEKGRIVVVTSTQIPHIVRRVIGQALGIPWGQVRVIKPYIGGGFGNKQDVLYEPLNAFLTTQVGGRPVKLEISREETFVNTRTRHKIYYELKMGLSRDGHILSRDMKAVSNQGAYASHGHAIAANGATAWRHMYRVPNVIAKAYTVYTNTPVGGAMRGYGIPQFAFAAECITDDAAVKLGMDPYDFRMENIHHGFFADPYLKPIAANTNGLAECMKKGAQYIHWKEKRAAYAGWKGNIRRGVGMAIFSYKTGVWPISLEIAGVRMSLNQDGSVSLMTGATEIGQGADTVFTQIAAEVLGIPVEQIHIQTVQDTDVTPFDTGAYASRQSFVTGRVIMECGQKLKENILEYTKELLGRRAEKERHASGGESREAPAVKSAGNGRTEVPADICDGWIVDADGKHLLPLAEMAQECYYSLTDSGVITAEVSSQVKRNTIAFGATFAEIEVDLALGKIEVLDIINVHDSGRLINPQLAQMQVHGGMSMGLGYGLSEQLLMDEKSGSVLNGNLLDYKLPTAMDTPELHTDFVELEDPEGPFGNKALGEPPVISPAPALRNALLNATGVAVNELPLSPQRLVDAFCKAGLLEKRV